MRDLPVLSDDRHDAVKDSAVGQYLDRLIREDFARGGGMNLAGGGNVIQQLWVAFGGKLSRADGG